MTLSQLADEINALPIGEPMIQKDTVELRLLDDGEPVCCRGHFENGVLLSDQAANGLAVDRVVVNDQKRAIAGSAIHDGSSTIRQ